MNQEILGQINEQINKEFFSAYLYLDIANYYHEESLDGFANWFQIQAQEERDHAMLFIDYLRNNDAEVVLQEISAPGASYDSAKAPLEVAYAHEKSVTKAIHDLYDKAMQLKDFRTMQYLNWFIKEQNEEEKIIKDIREKLSLLGGKKQGLYLMDNELKTRSYTPPSVQE